MYDRACYPRSLHVYRLEHVHTATLTRYARTRASAGYSVHWGTPCFMRLISMAWEPEDCGSARNAIFTMLSLAPDSFAFLCLRIENVVFITIQQREIRERVRARKLHTKLLSQMRGKGVITLCANVTPYNYLARFAHIGKLRY